MSPFLSILSAAESLAPLSADNLLESISSMVRTNTSESAKDARGTKRVAVITNKEIHLTKEHLALVCRVVIGLPLFAGLYIYIARRHLSRQQKTGLQISMRYFGNPAVSGRPFELSVPLLRMV
jgi:hypothetical protein